MSMEFLSPCAITHPPPEIAEAPEKRLKLEPETPLKSDSASQPVVTELPPKSAEASRKQLKPESLTLSERLYNMEMSEIREMFDNSEEPFYYGRNGYIYRNPAQIRLDEEIKKAMDEYRERRRNLSVYDAIAPPAIAHLLGSVRPLTITDDNRPILINLCNLALNQYTAENQGEIYVFLDLVKSTSSLVSGRIYYITFEATSGDAIKTFQASVEKESQRGSACGSVVFLEAYLTHAPWK